MYLSPITSVISQMFYAVKSCHISGLIYEDCYILRPKRYVNKRKNRWEERGFERSGYWLFEYVQYIMMNATFIFNTEVFFLWSV